MKRAFAAAAMAAGVFAVLVPSAGHADSYCVRSGITIMGEPWLAHEQCVDCPVQHCPDIPSTDQYVPGEASTYVYLATH